MAVNTLVAIGNVVPTNAVGDHVDQYYSALSGDIVPRTGGAAANKGGALGTNTYRFNGANISGAVDVQGQAYSNMITLTDTTTITTDCSSANVFKVTLAGNRDFAAPSNLKAGSTYIWMLNQDATGSRTATFDSTFKFGFGTAPTLTTSPGAIDIVSGVSDGTSVFCSTGFDFS